MAPSTSPDSGMSAELPAPYGAGPAQAAPPAAKPAGRIRTHHLRQAKEKGERFAMLTAYDQYSAEIFDAAGIEVLLVGDSASNNVFGNETSLPVTVDELLPLCRAVARSARRALVVADLPFGSYEVSAQQAVATGVRFLKEGLAHAVKIEGGKFYAETVRAMVQAGIPVMAHIGFTPQSEHALGGCRGRRRRGPHDRHRGRQRDHRPGAGVAGHGRAAGRENGQVRQAVRGPADHAERRRQSLRRRCPLGPVPRPGALVLASSPPGRQTALGLSRWPLWRCLRS